MRKYMTSYRAIILGAAAFAAASACAATVVDVTGAGAAKKSVSINVDDAEYAKCLKKNL